MRNRELVYQSLNIIEGHLKENINVFTLSQEFGFSLYYFSRIFKAVTDFSLKEYILLRKVHEAYRDIINSDKKIIDVAFEYGFSSHESFTRAFSRLLGFNPSLARKKENIVSYFAPLTWEVLENKQQNHIQEPELIQLGAFYLIGIPFYYDIALHNDLSKPWHNLISNASLLKDRIIPERFYQLQYWFPDQEDGLYYFFIALQMHNITDIPIQFTAKMIPAQRYLRFFHRGKSNSVGDTYKYIYYQYLPDTSYKLPHHYNFEYYGKQFLGPYDEESESEIYIPIEGE
ncbi:AraC family transcriptional regulator [Spirochaeta cellobiosiphila]|uniref:AraC family transcriptional regulator n=1 Tax=Spirochaeta cellobiosiphila TaxID=504483 RepID=UPI0004166C3E|nr:AraC family transcriptional regulator [Spirochaeta cellobiosiphila]